VQVGILGGTGPAGRGLAARLASVGVEVILGSRSAERAGTAVSELAKAWPDHQLALEGAHNSVAARCDVVVVATPWDGAPTTAGEVAGDLAGKVVISMANALVKIGKELHPLVPPRGSVAAAVQAAAPEALVVAALHHVPAKELGDIARPVESDVLVCSDHRDALAATAELLARLPGLRPLDAGSLANAAAIEAFTAVILNLNIRYRTRAAIRLTGVLP
jgi:NADPH-dependent F420 reductase